MAEQKLVKILFIEDENLLQSLFTDVLSLDTEFKYEVSNAASLESGLKAAETNRPNVVILDMIIPLDGEAVPSPERGMTFIEKVKTNPSLKSIPIIVFSNLDDAETKKRAFDLGADSYLVKSESVPQTFLATLKKTLSKTGF
jgi:CheY-like chemotaxis protein